MGCDRLFHLKDLPAVLLLTVATRPTPSMHGVGIVLGIAGLAVRSEHIGERCATREDPFDRTLYIGHSRRPSQAARCPRWVLLE
jgi:hypothetical protein